MMPEYDVIDFVEQAWVLRCTRCKFESVLAGPVQQQTAAQQFTADGWELRDAPRLLCPTCTEEVA